MGNYYFGKTPSLIFENKHNELFLSLDLYRFMKIIGQNKSRFSLLKPMLQ